MTRAILVTGAGGVGKTTVSGALALGLADHGVRTLVITVDPARRLADALGLKDLVPGLTDQHVGGAGPVAVPGAEGLWAAMLDVTAAWEATVHRHAPPDAAARLLVNPFFRAIADRFPAAQAYAAGEQMTDHLESGQYDVVVVDTPPAGGGIDFFLAPRRMRDLVGGRLLRWLTGARIPARRAIYRITARPVLRLADTVLGGPLLEDVAEFLFDLRTLYDGLSRRARRVERHLRAATSVVVTTASPTPLREAARFFETLPDVAGTPASVIFNRALPDEWAGAERLPPPDGELPAETRAALREAALLWAAEARRQHDLREEFATRHHTGLAVIPWLPESPASLDGLRTLLDVASGVDPQRLAGL